MISKTLRRRVPSERAAVAYGGDDGHEVECPWMVESCQGKSSHSLYEQLRTVSHEDRGDLGREVDWGASLMKVHVLTHVMARTSASATTDAVRATIIPGEEDKTNSRDLRRPVSRDTHNSRRASARKTQIVWTKAHFSNAVAVTSV